MAKKKKLDVRFGVAPDFAEVAETLKVPTDHIMAMREGGEGFLVLYTPSLPDDLDPLTDNPDVYSVSLRRDSDGILVRFGEPSLMPGAWENIRRQMEGK